MIDVAWDRLGLAQLARDNDGLVIVDVLSFTTTVSVTVARGACVLPYRWKDASALDYARQHNAELASGRGSGAGWSLSPSSMLEASAGLRIVLPSPNGSRLTVCGPVWRIGSVLARSVHQLAGPRTAAARAAAAAFVELQGDLDVRIAAVYNAPYAVAERLVEGVYIAG